jgi:lipoyl(octanoyl) transferase
MMGMLRVVDLGLCAYRPVLKLQERFVELRKSGSIRDTIILVEHLPVYTLGRRAHEENVVASAAQLAKWSIEVVPTGRGGDVTYHGPGQLVGYPIIKLSEFGRGPGWYVDRLEEAIIRTLQRFSIEGKRDAINRGVWIGQSKVAAIGVRISRGVTMHGFALNVTTNLDHYTGIIPCGIHNCGVTSIEKMKTNVGMAEVKNQFLDIFQDVFDYTSVKNDDKVICDRISTEMENDAT